MSARLSMNKAERNLLAFLERCINVDNTITVGSPAYRSILARVNHLQREQRIRPLTKSEQAELKREHAKLEAAELAYDAAQQGSRT